MPIFPDEKPVHLPILFRSQKLIGNAEIDQVTEDKNDIVCDTIKAISDAMALINVADRAAYEELAKAVASFNRGIFKGLDLGEFKTALAEMIDIKCDTLGIEFDHGLGEGVPALLVP